MSGAAPPLKKARTVAFSYKETSRDVQVIFLGLFLTNGVGESVFFHVEGAHGDKTKRFNALLAKVEANKDGLFVGKNAGATLTDKTALGFLDYIKSSKDMPDDIKGMVAQILSIEAALKAVQEQKKAQKEEDENIQ